MHRHVAVAVLLSVALRVRFVFAPIGDDEGVLVAAARAWARGFVPYGTVWFDRPLGAIVLVRPWAAMASPVGLRWLAVAVGAVLVVATAGLARSLAAAVGVRRPDLVPSPDRVAALAALIVAVWSSSPVVLGTATGPVLAGAALVTVALWLSAGALAGRSGGRAALAAGVCCGAAISLDLFVAFAALVVPCWLALTALRRRHRAAALPVLRMVGVGIVAVTAPLLVHALVIGWSTWWSAVVVARLGRTDPQQWVLLVVVGAVVVGLVAGRVQRVWWRAALSTVLLSPAAWAFGSQVFRGDDAIATGSAGRGAAHAEVVGRWLRANTAPDDRLYALCSGAAVYSYADRLPAVPYLSGDDLRRAADSTTLLVAVLSGADRPEIVVVFDLPADCGSPSLVGVLDRFYDELAVVDGVQVLRATGA